MSDISTSMMHFVERFLDVSSQRHQLIVTNMANVDTPGYRTKDLDFRSELQRLIIPGQEPTISLARNVNGLMQRPDGNDVNIDRESLLMAETQMQFGLGVQFMQHEFRNLLMAINEGSKS